MAEIRVDLKVTEEPEKIIAMIKNIFPHSILKVGIDEVLGDIKDDDFWKLVDKQNIRKTIETEIEKNKGYIDLSKMAAIAGKISVNEDFPLGKIRLTFKG